MYLMLLMKSNEVLKVEISSAEDIISSFELIPILLINK